MDLLQGMLSSHQFPQYHAQYGRSSTNESLGLVAFQVDLEVEKRQWNNLLRDWRNGTTRYGIRDACDLSCTEQPLYL